MTINKLIAIDSFIRKEVENGRKTFHPVNVARCITCSADDARYMLALYQLVEPKMLAVLFYCTCPYCKVHNDLTAELWKKIKVRGHVSLDCTCGRRIVGNVENLDYQYLINVDYLNTCLEAM